MAAVWPRLMPLLEEDGDVEANVPWQRWLQTAAGRKNRNLQWMVRQFAQLPAPDADKALLYDSLRLPVRWRLGQPALLAHPKLAAGAASIFSS